MAYVASNSIRGAVSDSSISVLGAVGSVANGVATFINAAAKSADILDLYVDTSLKNYRDTCKVDRFDHQDRLLAQYVKDALDRMEKNHRINFPDQDFNRAALLDGVTKKYQAALEAA